MIDKLRITRDRRGMLAAFLQVGLGGAIGSVLRFGMGLAVVRATGTAFPLAILPVNIIGSFLMGFLFVLLEQRGMTHFGPFLLTGVLGGFTTFSAFSLETFTLYERGDLFLAIIYVLASVVLSVLGLALGVWVAREGLA